MNYLSNNTCWSGFWCISLKRSNDNHSVRALNISCGSSTVIWNYFLGSRTVVRCFFIEINIQREIFHFSFQKGSFVWSKVKWVRVHALLGRGLLPLRCFVDVLSSRLWSLRRGPIIRRALRVRVPVLRNLLWMRPDEALAAVGKGVRPDAGRCWPRYCWVVEWIGYVVRGRPLRWAVHLGRRVDHRSERPVYLWWLDLVDWWGYEGGRWSEQGWRRGVFCWGRERLRRARRVARRRCTHIYSNVILYFFFFLSLYFYGFFFFHKCLFSSRMT